LPGFSVSGQVSPLWASDTGGGALRQALSALPSPSHALPADLVDCDSVADRSGTSVRLAPQTAASTQRQCRTINQLSGDSGLGAQLRLMSAVRQAPLGDLQNCIDSFGKRESRNHRDVFQQRGQFEVRLPAFLHEVDRIFRLAGMRRHWIRIEKEGDIGQRHKLVHKTHESPAHRIAEVEVRKLVVDVTIDNDDTRSSWL